MVSSVLAQAILSQEAPDIVGAFKEGQRTVREDKTRELAGKALSGGGIDPLLSELNPEVAFALGEQLRARGAQDISDFLRDAQIVKSKLDAGDVQGSLQFSQQRRNAIANRGGDTTQTDQFISTLSNDPEQARQELAALLGSVEQAKTTAGQKEAEFQAEALVGAINPETKKPFTREEALQEIVLRKSGITSRATTSPEELARRERLKLEEQLAIKPQIKGREESEKAITVRKQGFIDSGVDAADSTANIKRSLSLLQDIKTGGFNNASLRAKQFFGVEGADEGELSANLGVAVLAQLKPIFGAAFTAAEGERLERISAGFGRNAETNKRLLNQALKVAQRASDRAIKAAESEGDDFTAQQIRDALSFTLDDSQAETEVEQPKVMQFDAQGNLIQ